MPVPVCASGQLADVPGMALLLFAWIVVFSDRVVIILEDFCRLPGEKDTWASTVRFSKVSDFTTVCTLFYGAVREKRDYPADEKNEQKAPILRVPLKDRFLNVERSEA